MGCCPLILTDIMDECESVLQILDGLVLTDRLETGSEYPEQLFRQDASDIEFARAAIEADLPLLGLGRGSQMINVALGGQLSTPFDAGANDATLSSQDSSRVAREIGDHREHDVAIAPNSKLRRIIGPALRVRCRHMRRIEFLGTDVVAVGEARDGTVEAIEVPKRSFIIGTQWTPQPGATTLALMESLFEAARVRSVT
jgi:putative glutamine amidotransferase